jgi:hypothetical protein
MTTSDVYVHYASDLNNADWTLIGQVIVDNKRGEYLTNLC